MRVTLAVLGLVALLALPARSQDPAAARREAALALVQEALVLRDQKRDYQGALALLAQAIERDPDLAQAYQEKGTTHLKVGEFVPGMLEFCRAVERDPALTKFLEIKLYQIALVMPNLDNVLRDVGPLAEQQPPTPEALFLRAVFGIRRLEAAPPKGGWDDAVAQQTAADLEKALTLRPEHHAARLARARLELRRAARAQEPATRAAALDAAREDLRVVIQGTDGRLPTAHELHALLLVVQGGDPALTDADRLTLRAEAIEALRLARGAGTTPTWLKLMLEDPAFAPLRGDPDVARLSSAQTPPPR